MRGIGRILVMDRPQPAVADAALSAHGPQPGAVLAAPRPRWHTGDCPVSRFSIGTPVVIFNSRPASTQTEEKEKDV